MLNKTCKCPICGQTANYQGINGWADTNPETGHVWYCPNCDFPWWGDEKGINEDEARNAIVELDLLICSTCRAPFGPEYEGQKICSVCEKQGQLSLFERATGAEG